MTEDEKQAIRASFAGKRVSQMTDIERQVFDEDFQYGVASRGSQSVVEVQSAVKKTGIASILKRFSLRK
jgi:hypothetical protein